MSEKKTKKPATKSTASDNAVEDKSKRDFVVMAAGGVGAVGACAAAWPMIDSMNPSADVLAQSSTEVDISAIAEGQQKKVMWRGKPVFIYHRTAEQIAEAEAVDVNELKDPQTDAERVKPGKEKWLVMVGVCTHLGCIPIDNKGDYDGWFCPCHGSHYDSAGRIRKGPARKNLVIPPYEFLSDTKIKIG
ncbi:MAG: ubiquinol-cytochrome c reductase iron-sulfur subunit [Alphaproteobacteria bacterium CG11_big_fil_rev_8_21_14_0_20_44_7]|nr:MAG: ubiquinol-cytochrome c reductase iron-sulfur subunit [Alphaproteobacteria bacterium CG11_big_fil_rev_8_21_14_0_20_44_7]